MNSKVITILAITLYKLQINILMSANHKIFWGNEFKTGAKLNER